MSVDVPNVAGVPAVAFAPGASIVPALLTADAIDYFATFGPQWGIFDGIGLPVVVADTVVALDYRADWAISDYPVEEGSFESYDKVSQPYEGRIRFAAGGSPEARQSLLDSVDAIAHDLNLYDIVTPDKTYTSCNVHHYDYRRTRQAGVGMIEIDVWVKEIRVATTSYGTTQAASGASPENGGTVQPTDPSGVGDGASSVRSSAVGAGTTSNAGAAVSGYSDGTPTAPGTGGGGVGAGPTALPEIVIVNKNKPT